MSKRRELNGRFEIDLYEKLKRCWDDVGSQQRAPGWTSRTIEALRTFAEKRLQTGGNKLEFAAKSKLRAGRSGYESEYLVDASAWLVAKGRKNSNLDYRGLELVCEIEWSEDRDNREYDFTKLVDIRARHRVFICAANINERDEAKREVVDRLQRFIDRHHFTTDGDRFLVIVCGYGRGRGKKDADYGWLLRKNRPPESLE